MSEADPSTNPDAFDPALPADELFALLADGNRRNVLRHLLDSGEEVSLEELSAGLANGEGGFTSQPLEEFTIALHHAHLPELADAGLVRYDTESGMVELRSPATEIAPLLDLVATFGE